MITDEKRKEWLFPFDEVRPIQDELLLEVEKTLREKKNLIVHAPTGLGKTASTLPIALSFAIKEGLKVIFLTNRHTQHQIALDTLQKIKDVHRINFSAVDLIGKKAMCSQPKIELFASGEFNEYCKGLVEDKSCGFYTKTMDKTGPTWEAEQFAEKIKRSTSIVSGENIVLLAKQEEFCSYEIASILAKKCQVIIADYNYIFNPFIRKTFLHKLDIALEKVILIVDEGHNLPNRVSEMLNSKISNFSIRNALNEARKTHHPEAVEHIERIAEALNELNEMNMLNHQGKNFEEKETLTEKDFFLKSLGGKGAYDQLLAELETAGDEIRKKHYRSYIGALASFLNGWLGEDPGFIRYISQKPGKEGTSISLNHIGIDPSFITRDVFHEVYASVVMSGTLTPPKMYCDLLGIERSVEKIFSSPFPPENKLAMIVPLTTTRYEVRGEEMFKRMGQICTEMVSLIPGNILIFFPSYGLLSSVSRHIQTKEKKMLFEKREFTKKDKLAMLREFKRNKEPGAVLFAVAGANFAEGIDLPGNQLNGVIVVGLPLGRPDLKTEELIKYYIQKFSHGREYAYVYPAFNKCLQSAGRCIRSETDKGTVIFLDERFILPGYFKCFPKENLIVTKDYQTYLKKFWEK